MDGFYGRAWKHLALLWRMSRTDRQLGHEMLCRVLSSLACRSIHLGWRLWFCMRDSSMVSLAGCDSVLRQIRRIQAASRELRNAKNSVAKNSATKNQYAADSTV